MGQTIRVTSTSLELIDLEKYWRQFGGFLAVDEDMAFMSELR